MRRPEQSGDSGAKRTDRRIAERIIMGINGVDSYYTQDFAVQNQEKGNGSLTTEFELKGNTATSQENAGNKKPLGLTTVGNQGYVATYADSSTAQDPVIKVGECEIHVNNVDPRNATKMEMFALMSYMEDKGLIQNRGMKSFNKMTAYASQAEYNGYCNGIYDENAAWTTKRDWTGILENAKGSFMSNSQTYKQGLECENIIDNLKKWSKTSYASDEEETDDYWKIISDRKNEIYEKVKNGDTEETFQIGGSSFTQKEWDKLLSEVDDIMKEMREAMREEHQKRVEEDTEEENAKKAESVVNADVISKLFETESAEIQVSNFKEYETANYKFVPEPTIGDGGMRIVKNGQSVAVFSVDDLKIRVDEETGTRVLISELGGFDSAWFDAIPMDEELENGLAEAMGVENIPEVTLGGYYIGTHAGTGIQYVMRPGDEGRGGKVLLRNERDVAKYNALAEEYYNRYPNLINSQEEGRIWASFEIVGMAERTETGFVRIGFDNIYYNDNSDFKKNWSVKLTGNTWELLNEWLKESRNGMKEWQEFSSWKDIFDEIGGSYERIWSDEELRQGYLNN